MLHSSQQLKQWLNWWMWSFERRRHLSEKNLTHSEEREERMSPGAVPPQNTPTWVMGVSICVKGVNKIFLLKK